MTINPPAHYPISELARAHLGGRSIAPGCLPRSATRKPWAAATWAPELGRRGRRRQVRRPDHLGDGEGRERRGPRRRGGGGSRRRDRRGRRHEALGYKRETPRPGKERGDGRGDAGTMSRNNRREEMRGRCPADGARRCAARPPARAAASRLAPHRAASDCRLEGDVVRAGGVGRREQGAVLVERVVHLAVQGDDVVRGDGARCPAQGLALGEQLIEPLLRHRGDGWRDGRACWAGLRRLGLQRAAIRPPRRRTSSGPAGTG
jgi:hypothetical protein